MTEKTAHELRTETDGGLNDQRECPWCLRQCRRSGMPRCHGCWEVQGHLPAFLRSEVGRDYVREALAMTKDAACLDALEAELEAATAPVDPVHVLRALRRARGGSE